LIFEDNGLGCFGLEDHRLEEAGAMAVEQFDGALVTFSSSVKGDQERVVIRSRCPDSGVPLLLHKEIFKRVQSGVYIP
jgi:hypothetical protein